MKIDIVEIKKSDTILTPLEIGRIPPSEVDAFVKKTSKTLKKIFKCKIGIYPMRDCGGFDFTIIRKVK